MMEESVRSKKMEDLLALRGRISIDYDWDREENVELKAAEDRELLIPFAKIFCPLLSVQTGQAIFAYP